jgi:lipid-A-disaccharide synthase
VIICVDFAGFNRRFAQTVRRLAQRQQRSGFNNWRPRIVQFVSPQVWASRPARAFSMAADLDLLLVTFPFERDWYAQKFPLLPVKFVGNPALERHDDVSRKRSRPDPAAPHIVLLPGSRAGEVRRHLPVVRDTACLILAQKPGATFTLVVPTEELKRTVEACLDLPKAIAVVAGPVAAPLSQADLAITKSGTITLECALFGMPAVVFYKTSWVTYVAARMVIGVDYLSMPNLLAGRALYPEFVQHAATPENLARCALDLLQDRTGLEALRLELNSLIEPLRKRGSSRRAAQAILRLLD